VILKVVYKTKKISDVESKLECNLLL